MNFQAFSGEIRENEKLAKHTYYQIGGPARWLVLPKNLSDLKILARELQATRFFIMGAGSNLLISDEGFNGVIIKMTQYEGSIEESADELVVGASVIDSKLLRYAGEKGLKGFERFTGIPGSVGGLISMNGGTHLGEAKDLVKWVEIFSLKTGDVRTVQGTELKFEYRKNHFLKSGDIILRAGWKKEQGDPSEVSALIQETLRRRKGTQPLEHPSCGSVFKNPKNTSLKSWQVMEKLGLRGHRIGNAQFSEKHCNFIVNLGKASSEDVRALIALAKKRAHDELGITLEEEVIYLST